MKVDNKSNESGPRVAQQKVLWINFNDKAVDKLFIESGNRITVKFKNVKVPYLTGLVLRYSPLTQKKKFYNFSYLIYPTHHWKGFSTAKFKRLNHVSF